MFSSCQGTCKAIAVMFSGHFPVQISASADADAPSFGQWEVSGNAQDPAVPPPASLTPVVPTAPVTKKFVVLQTNRTLSGILPKYKKYHDALGLEFVEDFENSPKSEADLLNHTGTFDAVIASTDKWSRRVIEANAAVGRLKIIQRWGTGYDAVDLEAAKECRIRVCNIPNAFSVPVAETTLGMMLAFAREIPELDRDLKGGGWTKMRAHTLRESTIGIIGCGNIGMNTALRASAFGSRLLVTDVHPIDRGFLERINAQQVPLERLLAESDYVTVHTDLNASSHHLMNKRTIRLMKPTAVLINCARGPCVCEEDLIDALQKKVIRGAGVDVFETEPLPRESPLKSMHNVLLSPHNSHQSPMAYEALHWICIRNVCQALGIPTNRDHEPPNDLVSF